MRSIIPNTQLRVWVISVGSRIANGSAEPYPARIEAAVVGISSTDEVFNRRKVARERFISLPGFRAARAFVAFIPAGVAAFPRPNIFEEMFMQMLSSASESEAASGISLFITGRSARLMAEVIPVFFATFIIPEKKHMLPHILKHRTIASPAPESIADDT